MRRAFLEAHFVGEMRDERLAAACHASADVFVFPSLTDTFVLVLLEALASGLPVAANPVVGPLDVIGDSVALGVLDAKSRSPLRSQLSQFPESLRVPVLLPSASANPRDNLSTTCLPRIGPPHWMTSRAPFETMNPHLVPLRDRGGLAAQIEALRERGGND